MAHQPKMLFAGTVALACMAWSPAVVAEPDEGTSAAAPPQAVSAAFSVFGSRPLDLLALSAERGGTEVFNDMTLEGVVADNQASQLVTGGNFISDGAFSGASGLPMVIQNSGNNVLIQNATIVNVQVN
jgi:hypothetical protein